MYTSRHWPSQQGHKAVCMHVQVQELCQEGVEGRMQVHCWVGGVPARIMFPENKQARALLVDKTCTMVLLVCRCAGCRQVMFMPG
jgi:hypothetical protein